MQEFIWFLYSKLFLFRVCSTLLCDHLPIHAHHFRFGDILKQKPDRFPVACEVRRLRANRVWEMALLCYGDISPVGCWDKGSLMSGEMREMLSGILTLVVAYQHTRAKWWTSYSAFLRIIWVLNQKKGETPKWMVYFMENPMNKWMIWGETPLFLETIIYSHVSDCQKANFNLSATKNPELLGRIGSCHLHQVIFASRQTGGQHWVAQMLFPFSFFSWISIMKTKTWKTVGYPIESWTG